MLRLKYVVKHKAMYRKAEKKKKRHSRKSLSSQPVKISFRLWF